MDKHDEFPQDDWLRERFDTGPMPPEPFTGNVLQRIEKDRRRRRIILTVAAGAGVLAATPGMAVLWDWITNLTGSVLADGIPSTALPTALTLGMAVTLIGVAIVGWLDSG